MDEPMDLARLGRMVSGRGCDEVVTRELVVIAAEPPVIEAPFVSEKPTLRMPQFTVVLAT
jgi:hypothetical protein